MLIREVTLGTKSRHLHTLLLVHVLHIGEHLHQIPEALCKPRLGDNLEREIQMGKAITKVFDHWNVMLVMQSGRKDRGLQTPHSAPTEITVQSLSTSAKHDYMVHTNDTYTKLHMQV